MPFHSATARTGRRRGLSSAYRRLGYALVLGILGYIGTADSVSATPAAQPLLVDFFFDLADDAVAEPGLELDDAAGGPDEILIAGIPVRLGEHDGVADAGWRTIAGARGQHTLPITDALTMVNTVRVAGTDFVAERAPGKVLASAASDLRYASDGWTLAVRPAVETARRETYVLQQDSSMEGRISKSLGGGISLASTARYGWRDSMADQTQAEIAFGRFGLVCRLPQQLQLDMAYVVRQEVAAESTRGAGPSVTVTLPLVEHVDLAANYDFTETARYDSADAEQARLTWDQHHLGLGTTWDVGGNAADAEVSAAYRYEHGGSRTDAGVATHHAGTVSFALDF